MNNVEKIINDVSRLDVNLTKMKESFVQLEGTRHIIQYQGKDYTFSLSKTFKPKVKCFGLTNRCADMGYVFFADYDKIYKALVLKNLDQLIKRFPNCFDNFYIVRTGKEEILENGEVLGSYHVINFVKHTKRMINKFLEYCDIDPSFREIPQKTEHKTHVLRLSEKFYELNGKIVKDAPEFDMLYPNYPLLSGKECSKAHYLFFQNQWGHPTQLSHLFDKLKVVEYHGYSTPSKKTDAGKIDKDKYINKYADEGKDDNVPYLNYCPKCNSTHYNYVGIENYVSCDKCGFTWGLSE